MSNLSKALKEIYGKEAKTIERELRDEVHELLESGTDVCEMSEHIEDILSNYGLEPDFIPELLTY